ncbi:rRNA maturation RNase YbeY [Desulfobacterium sp. N47]
MGVLINNSQNKLRIRKIQVRKAAQAILNALDCPKGELSILIEDDDGITGLNEKYLQRKGPANVISFPLRDVNFPEIEHDLLGDVVISAETTQREGNSLGTGFDKRFAELLIHGILHLFGYDHEKSEQEADEMEIKASKLLKIIENSSFTFS